MATARAVPPLAGCVVTAAVDFGTSCSGYAFTFRHEPMRIYTNAWRANGATTTTKAPTVILFDPDGEFHSFGFEAEEFYTELIEAEDEENKDEYKKWFYFQHFKMELYRQKRLTMETELEDVEGKSMSAFRLFSESIGYLKQRLMGDVRNTNSKIQDDDIFWILTVPAIWSEPAKRFMREAANKAGIDNCRLRLVLEPEAASIYCQANCTLRDLQAGGVVKLEPFQVDHTYIVADLGGGTADIATHQVLHGNKLRELFRATGGDLGAAKVNNNFTMFLKDIFGDDVIDDFQRRSRVSYMELMRDFENQKKSVRMEATKPMRIRCPPALTECIQEHHHKSITEYLKDTGANMLTYKADKFHISAKMVDIFFKDVSDNIVQTIIDIFKLQQVRIDSLLLVGGFADSEYLHEKIKTEIIKIAPAINFIKPEEAGLHVLKGAALTTVLQTVICERISPFAYGLRMAVPFEKGLHPDCSKEMRKSGSYCSDIFEKFIEKGRILKIGETIKYAITTSITNAVSKLEDRSIELFRSSEPDPKYTFGDSCERVAKIVLEHPREGWPDIAVFEVEILIGETEFEIDVVNGTTGQKLTATVDFLGH